MRTQRTIHRLPLTEARNGLGALVDRIRSGKEGFILEKRGVPVAALVDVDEFEDYLDAQDPRLDRQIRRGREEYERNELTETIGTYLVRLEAKPAKRRR